MTVRHVVHRAAARVLLLDEADRVLLFRGCDPDRPERSFWLAPGGGLDEGETAEAAAMRELREETGLRDVTLGPPVWRRRALFTVLGTTYDQQEIFFLARCSSFAVDTAGFTPLERRAVLDHRWWTLEELEVTTDHLAPADLPQRLAELLRSGPPAEPVDVLGAALP